MNDGGPAFPRPPFTPGKRHDQLGDAGFVATGHPGMSLRDWFAGQAMSGMMVSKTMRAEFIAYEAYVLADAMLKAREGGAQ